MISAIILAAGLSSRMGYPKQLLELGNRYLIRIVTENVLASAVDEVIVVTGCRQDEVEAFFNPHYSKGQGTSLALGVKAINIDTNAFLVFMCDQPLIAPSTINKVIWEFKKRNSLALRPVYQGIPGHPVIFSCSLISEIERLKGDEGARELLKKLGDRVEYLPVQDEAVILDMDTPEGYEKMKKRYELFLKNK
jgi:molybdenum cofactor cytidylyltransferase